MGSAPPGFRGSQGWIGGERCLRRRMIIGVSVSLLQGQPFLSHWPQPTPRTCTMDQSDTVPFRRDSISRQGGTSCSSSSTLLGPLPCPETWKHTAEQLTVHMSRGALVRQSLSYLHTVKTLLQPLHIRTELHRHAARLQFRCVTSWPLSTQQR